uniref:NADH dehydrogenase [ubiquinone] iron-sulfur protein 5 n=1 Tax=Calcidiscus leptoporus TaxID=127549 RepID=A0A7S0J7U5_9EUKA
MSSGWGSRGQMGRCFPVYQEFSDCVALGDKSACAELRDDYYECLHHNKEIKRVNAINLERERKIKEGLPVPTSLTEDAKSGELKLPFTKAQ